MEEKSLLALVEKLNQEHSLRREEWEDLIRYRTPEVSERVFPEPGAGRGAITGIKFMCAGS